MPCGASRACVDTHDTGAGERAAPAVDGCGSDLLGDGDGDGVGANNNRRGSADTGVGVRGAPDAAAGDTAEAVAVPPRAFEVPVEALAIAELDATGTTTLPTPRVW